MAHLHQVVPDDFRELLTYFDTSYVNGPCRSVRCPPSASQPSQHRIRVRRLPPLFPPKTWNVNAATLLNDPRTNNECEAWNNAFSQQIGHSHPSLFALIDHLKKDNALAIAAIVAADGGQPPKKRIKKVTHDLQERLYNLCKAHRDGQKSTVDLLRAVGHTIRF